MVNFFLKCLLSIYRRNFHCQHFASVRNKAVHILLILGRKALRFLSYMKSCDFCVVKFNSMAKTEAGE